MRRQLVLARHVHWPDVADRLIQVGLLLAKVGLILNNARDEQRQSGTYSAPGPGATFYPSAFEEAVIEFGGISNFASRRRTPLRT